MKKKPALAPETTEAVHEALVRYAGALEPQQIIAAAEAIDAVGSLQRLAEFKISSKATYAALGEFALEAREKWKFLDEERKISVTPLNNEVSRVNDWYRPALDALKKVEDRCKRLMADFDLAQRAEEQRLLKKAQEEAQRVLREAQAKALEEARVAQEAAAEAARLEMEGAEGDEVVGEGDGEDVEPEIITTKTPEVQAASMEATSALVGAAAETQVPKVAGIGTKLVWKWEVTDPSKLEERFTKSVPDEEALEAWISIHGDEDVPAGVSVEQDINFRLTKKRAK